MSSVSRILSRSLIGTGSSAKVGSPAGEGGAEERTVTRIDPDTFHVPVKRLGVSGGTAPFFELKLRCPDGDKSVDHYIGKDLSRATDEIDFYETLLRLKREAGGPNEGLMPLFDFAFEYAGVLTAAEEGVPDSLPPLDLLVLRNLRDGKAKLRLLDLKMGKATAQAGWHGKSRLRAMKQGVLDAATNSTTEGFRLEGFDGCPMALESREPLMDVPAVGSRSDLGGLTSSLRASDKTMKKANRMMLQSMKGKDVFRHFVDLHMDFGDWGQIGDHEHSYAPIELGEIILHEVVVRLTRLLVACHKAPVPQKWIGSSVALGYDAGTLPKRSSSSEEGIRSTVLVNIFDWGRSELNTAEIFSKMEEAEKEDRRKFWKFYSDGISSLSWDAAREYQNRYGNAGSWEELSLSVYDYDSVGGDDLCGKVTVPVIETKLRSVSLKGGFMKIRGKGSISYSITWHNAPARSRLKGFFCVCIKEGRDLPKLDRAKGGLSDPYCIIKAKSSCGKYVFTQTTCVKAQDINPKWNEYFGIPVMKDGSQLCQAIEQGSGVSVSPSWLDSVLGAGVMGPEQWGERLKD